MNRIQLFLGIVLLECVTVESWALYNYGLFGFVRIALSNSVTLAIYTNLLVSLALILKWMTQDAEDAKVSTLPFILITIVFGCAGPLLYLIRRAADAKRPLSAIQD